MANYKTVESFTKDHPEGTYAYFLMKAEPENLWKVMSFERTGKMDETGCEEMEFQWEVTAKVVGYQDNNPNHQICEPFTEETAREEFERWR